MTAKALALHPEIQIIVKRVGHLYCCITSPPMCPVFPTVLGEGSPLGLLLCSQAKLESEITAHNWSFRLLQIESLTLRGLC